MSSYDVPIKKKLSFKAKLDNSKIHKRDTSNTKSQLKLSRPTSSPSTETWTEWTPQCSWSYSGPIVICSAKNNKSVLAGADDGSVSLVYLENNKSEPETTQQVWIFQKIPSSKKQTKFQLKSSFGKFLTTASDGSLSASNEAVGPDGLFQLNGQDGKYWEIKSESGADLKMIAKSSKASQSSYITKWKLIVQTRFIIYPSVYNDFSDESRLQSAASKEHLNRLATDMKLKNEDLERINDANDKGLLAQTLLDIRIKKKRDRFA